MKVVEDDYGTVTGSFQVKNPTDGAMRGTRIGAVCFQPSGKINGGGSHYPDLIPPSGKVLVEVNLITSGRIDRCEAYAAPGDF